MLDFGIVHPNKNRGFTFRCLSYDVELQGDSKVG